MLTEFWPHTVALQSRFCSHEMFYNLCWQLFLWLVGLVSCFESPVSVKDIIENQPLFSSLLYTLIFSFFKMPSTWIFFFFFLVLEVRYKFSFFTFKWPTAECIFICDECRMRKKSEVSSSSPAWHFFPLVIFTLLEQWYI